MYCTCTYGTVLYLSPVIETDQPSNHLTNSQQIHLYTCTPYIPFASPPGPGRLRALRGVDTLTPLELMADETA